MQAGEAMYNRYVPQQDGTYQKHRMKEPPQQKPHKPPQKVNCPTNPSAQDCPPAELPPPCPPPPQRPTRKPPQQGGSILGFFKNLLPGDLDTADLLIILLLLLMAGDREEDKNTALLTLALYFFL